MYQAIDQARTLLELDQRRVGKLGVVAVLTLIVWFGSTAFNRNSLMLSLTSRIWDKITGSSWFSRGSAAVLSSCGSELTVAMRRGPRKGRTHILDTNLDARSVYRHGSIFYLRGKGIAER